MPEQSALSRARRDAREGKSASTQAGEFIREEIHNIREGLHGARSAKQVIAIGLSKARRAGVRLPVPARGRVSAGTRRRAKRDIEQGRIGWRPSRARGRATLRSLRRESGAAASRRSLSLHARAVARLRGPKARSKAARKAARTRQQMAA